MAGKQLSGAKRTAEQQGGKVKQRRIDDCYPLTSPVSALGGPRRPRPPSAAAWRELPVRCRLRSSALLLPARACRVPG